MGQGASTGVSVTATPKGDVTELGSSKLVVTHVEVIRQREVIKVPEIVVEKVPTTQYVVQQEETVQYIPRQVETTQYVAREESTTKFIQRDEETVKYVPREVTCEKPIIVDKLYERPVLQEKEHQLVTFTDLEAIKELVVLAPRLLSELQKLKSYKLVEEVIRVPQVQFEPTTVERVVWADVHKCKKCGALVDGN